MKQWIDWPHDECPECGGAVQIETDCPQTMNMDENPNGWDAPYVYCGDQWRCEDGHVGIVYCDSETPVRLR